MQLRGPLTSYAMSSSTSIAFRVSARSGLIDKATGLANKNARAGEFRKGVQLDKSVRKDALEQDLRSFHNFKIPPLYLRSIILRRARRRNMIITASNQ